MRNRDAAKLLLTAALFGCRSTQVPPAPAASPPAAAVAPVAAKQPAGDTVRTEHVISMLGDSKGYRFEPENLEIRQGDKVRFIMVSGGPHNVTFQNVTDAAAKAQLDANMPGQKMGELAGPMVMQPNEAYVVSFAKVPAGKYDYICTPHAAMNMKGTITVQ